MPGRESDPGMSDYPFDVEDPDANPILHEESYAKLATLLGEGPDGIGDLVDTFVDTAPATVEEMRAAAEAGDLEALAKASHKLKGEAGTFGARRLQAVCKALELEARDGAVDDPVARVEVAEEVFEATVRALEAKVA
jgi:HPt (histidine-containing phosphotransfer) domain-containing protein